jgi:DNA-directed RNA polymerase subunit alpha
MINHIHDIPVTDFELTVLVRNGLRRLGVRTLGDLIEHSERELIELTNFGEISLNQIKELLNSKGLRLRGE